MVNFDFIDYLLNNSLWVEFLSENLELLLDESNIHGSFEVYKNYIKLI